MNGSVNVPYRFQRKPEGVLIGCIGFTCGLLAAALWVVAIFGSAA